MSTVGGFFCGKPLPLRKGEVSRNVTHQYAIVWGRAIEDAEDAMYQKRSVSFFVKYDEEYNPNYGKVDKYGHKEKATRGKFMKCHVSGKKKTVADVMAAVERGDIVICFGRLHTKRYTNKKQEDHQVYWMTADVVIPMAALGFVMDVFNSPSVQQILDTDRNAEMDAFES